MMFKGDRRAIYGCLLKVNSILSGTGSLVLRYEARPGPDVFPPMPRRRVLGHNVTCCVRNSVVHNSCMCTFGLFSPDVGRGRWSPMFIPEASVTYRLPTTRSRLQPIFTLLYRSSVSGRASGIYQGRQATFALPVEVPELPLPHHRWQRAPRTARSFFLPP